MNMGCRSDYQEQSINEKYLQDTAKNLVYLFKKLNKKVPSWIVEQSETMYSGEESLVPELCKQMKKLSKKQLNEIVYDGKNPEARKLADWWDKHQEYDDLRKRKEAEDKKTKALIASAKKKLTASEKKALGIE